MNEQNRNENRTIEWVKNVKDKYFVKLDSIKVPISMSKSFYEKVIGFE